MTTSTIAWCQEHNAYWSPECNEWHRCIETKRATKAILLVACEHGEFERHRYDCDCSPNAHRFIGCPVLQCNGPTELDYGEMP